MTVQEEASAKYPEMPRSAIEAGVADLFLPVEEIPGKLVAVGSRLAQAPRAEKTRYLPDRGGGSGTCPAAFRPPQAGAGDGGILLPDGGRTRAEPLP